MQRPFLIFTGITLVIASFPIAIGLVLIKGSVALAVVLWAATFIAGITLAICGMNPGRQERSVNKAAFNQLRPQEAIRQQAKRSRRPIWLGAPIVAFILLWLAGATDNVLAVILIVAVGFWGTVLLLLIMGIRGLLRTSRKANSYKARYK